MSWLSTPILRLKFSEGVQEDIGLKISPSRHHPLESSRNGQSKPGILWSCSGIPLPHSSFRVSIITWSSKSTDSSVLIACPVSSPRRLACYFSRWAAESLWNELAAISPAFKLVTQAHSLSQSVDRLLRWHSAKKPISHSWGTRLVAAILFKWSFINCKAGKVFATSDSSDDAIM
jgi:hypothetical protein